ncbi:hypothetical protein OPW39_22285 [Vibrio europaeus]|uniref:hypothetical protein n=1 Tax=Vibrio europaeus TaxID=300876 RepID=UPI00233E75EF|nr:hypothetical protein [Vibrio europaeus]MDC5871543.1 hypothetical protein [Vibrio europaeus]
MGQKPKLSLGDVKKIEKSLRTWKGKLTWDVLVETIQEQYDITATRQTLNTYGSVKEAFDGAKKRLRNTSKKVISSPNISLEKVDLVAKIEALEIDNKELEKQNDRLRGILHAIHIESEKTPQLLEVLRTVKVKYLSEEK